ncbi:MAG TPA: thioesterase family protein [Aggregatilineales bacterium]|nr:thioesterase family protein [Aggregatilineales bacterium]
MPATHIATFAVRHYECDAYGHLNNANYIHYMEEAAFQASTAVGYSKARYEAMGTLWLARETRIEYLAPLVYGDTVEVKTWVDDFRRVRSRRRYEFRRPGVDTLLAQAETDWVYLDATTQRPLVVPPEMITAFAPEGLPETATPRPKFPALPPVPPAPYSFRRKVEWRDIDTAQHVNNAAYFHYLEEAGVEAAAHFGWSMRRCAEAGFGIIAREIHIEYRLPALLGDSLEIETFVSDLKRSNAVRNYQVRRGTDVLAQARTRFVWVDLATGRPIRIPTEFAEAFAGHLAP